MGNVCVVVEEVFVLVEGKGLVVEWNGFIFVERVSCSVLTIDVVVFLNIRVVMAFYVRHYNFHTLVLNLSMFLPLVRFSKPSLCQMIVVFQLLAVKRYLECEIHSDTFRTTFRALTIFERRVRVDELVVRTSHDRELPKTQTLSQIKRKLSEHTSIPFVVFQSSDIACRLN